MSADVHEKIVFKEDRNLFRYSEGNLNFSATSYDDEYSCNKKKLSRDPMSHRIIEKRRRDRMNNCLADLSRLIPPEYLKKGRGRIEKTEIIEMAIKHMRHLQNIIASTRFNENSNSSVPSPPAAPTYGKEIPTIPKTAEHPNILKHYRMGYLECISEAMHFLVEVQGYFAGDSFCVQMINHLHKHCDNILKGNSLNFLKKSLGETTYSDSSTSPINVTYNTSPVPVGLSNSIDSANFENQRNPIFDAKVSEDGKVGPEFISVRKYADPCYSSEKLSEVCYPKYINDTENENLSDSEHHYQNIFKCRNNYVRKEESNSNLEALGNQQKNYQTYHNLEESGHGLSQLKEMLTSSVNIQMKDHSNKVFEAKGNISPLSNTSGYETSSGTTIQTFKSSPNKRMDSGQTDLPDGDNHYLMYKFKNNIQQRFSKENGANAECITNENLQHLKKPKPEECQKHPDPSIKQNLNLMDRMEVEEERYFKFNADFESRKKIRYGSESENLEDGITSRLNFGHKSEKAKKIDELHSCQLQGNSKAWAVSPNPTVPFFGSPGEFKPFCKELSEYSSSLNNPYHHHVSLPPPESGQGVPIFALHAKGSFYIPLTLDHSVLAPFLTILGIAKTDDALPEKTVLHPVTISVNFQSHFVQ